MVTRQGKSIDGKTRKKGNPPLETPSIYAQKVLVAQTQREQKKTQKLVASKDLARGRREGRSEWCCGGCQRQQVDEDARKGGYLRDERDDDYKIRQAFLFFFLLGASMGAGLSEGLLAV